MFTNEIKCPRCGRVGTLSLKMRQLCGKKAYEGPYWRIIHKYPRKECYVSRRMISTGGVLPHIVRKKRRALEFKKRVLTKSEVRKARAEPQQLETREALTQPSPFVREQPTRRDELTLPRARLEQVQMPTRPTLPVKTEPLRNLETKRVEEQPTASFTIAKDGKYITLRRLGELPVVVLVTRYGGLYCGGCLKKDCIHTQAVKQWLK